MSSITVGFSTRTNNPDFINYLKLSSGIKDLNVIQKINNGLKSLSEVYNEILNESETDIVVLCHDDLYFDTKNWGDKLIKQFEKNTHDILGVAGTTFLPSSGQWWEDQSKMVGIVNHEHQGKKWESKYSENLGNEIKNVVIVDGLFIALKKSKLKEHFDTSVSGFHMYDVNFCFQNYIKGLKVGVIYNIRITHKSIGQTNEQWEKNRQIFSDKYSDYLPTKVKVSENDFLKLMFIVENVDLLIEFLKTNLSKNKEITLISNNTTKENKKLLQKNGVKVYRLNEIPGYKFGDGRSFIKTDRGVIKSELGSYYKISNINYDIIVADSPENLNTIKTLYSQTPKILFKKEGQKEALHDSIFSCLDLSESQSLSENILNCLNSVEEKKQKVKIISGYSAEGGSTTILINLTNMFNERGVDTTFYGPHDFHLNKCKSDKLSNLKLDKDDILLTHFLKLEKRPNVKRVVLCCHEKWWFEVADIPNYWDTLVFSHEEHRQYHSRYSGPYTTIPNPKEPLVPKQKPELDLVAGVIGTVEERKQTHLSIERALEDGCTKIYIYGKVMMDEYFNKEMKKYQNHPNVEFKGYSNSKQEMYDSVGRVYHSSIGEVACLVKDECHYTNTKFFGCDQTTHEVSELSNDKIFDLWSKVLNL